jgi:GAF domain-containing protein
MTRRSKAGGEPIKGRRRKAPEPKLRNAPKVQARAKLSLATEETEVARLNRELNEALDRQNATSEVLRVISSSRGDLAPVFDAVLQNATRICRAKFGIMNFPEPGGVRCVAMHNVPEAFAELRRRDPVVHFGPKHPLARAVATKQVVHIPDLEQDAGTDGGDVVIAKFCELTGARTILHAPMLKEKELVGIVSIYRQEVRPFTDKQIDLVKNFAAQAVIAIENARLLNELRQRTTDLTERTSNLTEALEQQTATSEVLQVISSTPGDLQPVFATMLENAVRICDATFGNIYRWDGEALHVLASHNTPPAFAEDRRRSPYRPYPNSPIGRMVANKTVVHISDVRTEDVYTKQLDPVAVTAVTLGGLRTLLGVPLLNTSEMIGAFFLSRQEVRPFTDKQIALVQNFAAQAVIAIENTRLLNELRQSLAQQTATADVLKVISRSTFDLQTVLDTLVVSAASLCVADMSAIWQRDGEFLRLWATNGVTPEAMQYAAEYPLQVGRNSAAGRAALEGEAVHIPDVLADAEYSATSLREAVGYRTVLGAPLLRAGAVIGVFALTRREVSPFSEKQIELVTTFADQAVIAIENARLLSELRERTEEVLNLNQQLEQRVTDQVGEIERMGRLRRFLPPQVADLIVASGTEKQLESHRREITALFCDLRGFTGFTESADAEDVMALLRDYHAAIGEIIIKYNGTLERYAGDGVMVVFNDPVSVENPALQAVLMALEVRDAFGALTATWSRLGHDIGFGIGIAHGFATLGTIGFEGRFDYAAVGTVSNVASRLCDEAKPGQILISPRVLMKVENAVKVEPVGEFELKGIRRPLAAYNVVGAASQQA